MIRSVTSDQKCSLDTIGINRIPAKYDTKKKYEKKRAAKAITKVTMYRMFGLQSPINDDYRQAYMCNEYLFQKGNKITSNYCQKKCCTVCSRIKSAQSLSKYGSRLLELDDLHLVTLTDKNVGLGELESNVDQMFKALGRIKRNINKNYKDLKITGYRSFECTYKRSTGFNPHLHFIVSGKESAQLLVRLWLNQIPTADRKAQDIKKVNHSKKSLLEVFKYVAKPVTKNYGIELSEFSVVAYDEIMQVAKRHRCTEPLGKIRGKVDTTPVDSLSLDDLQAHEIDFKGNRIEVWKYVNELYDYVSPTGERLLNTSLDRKTQNAINVIQRSRKENRGQRTSPVELFYQSRPRPKDFKRLF